MSKNLVSVVIATFLTLLASSDLPLVHSQELVESEIRQYSLELEPDFTKKTITGTLRIHLVRTNFVDDEFVLNAGSLVIDSVSHAGKPLKYEKLNDELHIEYPLAVDQKEQIITLEYHGRPAYGIKFSEDAFEVSTAFSTSQWMPSLDRPHERARFALSIIVPENFEVAGTGRFISTQPLPNGKISSSWIEPKPMPGYLYGFVAGKFNNVSDSTDAPTLRYLVPPDFTEDQARKIFLDTRDMISFFEDKSGIVYSEETYTQVLLRKGSGQEMHGMSVMGEGYGVNVLSDEQAIWLGVHEVAHQWWGNFVTNQDWTHFWLNEGIASFMTAAYFEHRFGRESYEKNISAAEQQTQRLVDEGLDKPLVFPDWEKPTRDDRSVVYDKGSFVIHQLRLLLGEQEFWKGIKFYTMEHWASSVTTADFQTAMEVSSGKDLGEFFDEWVY